MRRERPSQGQLQAYQFNKDRYAQNHLAAADPPLPEADQEGESSLYASGEAGIYLSHASLANGKLGLIVDPGSVWDIAGSERAASVAYQAHLHGLKP